MDYFELFLSITAKDLAKELLREKCIARNLTDGNAQWFNYILRFRESCINPNKTLDFTDDCANKILKSLDISSIFIENCINSTFMKKGDFNSNNTYL